VDDKKAKAEWIALSFKCYVDLVKAA